MSDADDWFEEVNSGKKPSPDDTPDFVDWHAKALGVFMATAEVDKIVEILIGGTALMFPEWETDIAGDAAYGAALAVKEHLDEMRRDVKAIVGAMAEYKENEQ